MSGSTEYTRRLHGSYLLLRFFSRERIKRLFRNLLEAWSYLDELRGNGCFGVDTKSPTAALGMHSRYSMDFGTNEISTHGPLCCSDDEINFLCAL